MSVVFCFLSVYTTQCGKYCDCSGASISITHPIGDCNDHGEEVQDQVTKKYVVGVSMTSQTTIFSHPKIEGQRILEYVFALDLLLCSTCLKKRKSPHYIKVK